jgi:hypothetical protein
VSPTQFALTQSVGASQPSPVPHFVLQLPPQSTSVSFGPLKPSLQPSAAHTSLVGWQNALAQSPLPVHACPFGQRSQVVEPPQSMPDSPWFETASLQVGARQRPPMHTLLTQSVPLLQVWLSSHFVLQLPPQSTSVSLPFLTESLQVATWQMRFTQRPLWQSVAVRHAWPWMQLGPQSSPPQSRSDSSPLTAPSSQLGATQRPSLQTSLRQSALTSHAASSGHGPHAVPPPQSTSDSP